MSICFNCGKEVKPYKYKEIQFELCKDCGALIISKNDFEKLAKHVDTDCKIVDLFEIPAVTIKKEIRKCPYCNENMEQIYCEGVFIDRCKKCNMLLFDNGELSKYFTIFSKNPIEIMNNAKFIKTFCDIEIVEKADIKKERGSYMNSNKSKERPVARINGIPAVILTIFAGVLAFLSIILSNLIPFLMITGGICSFFTVILLIGFRVIKPQEAIVYTLFGKYYGTLKGAGFYWIFPLATPHYEHISLKVRTLENPKQKINDLSGNPIEVGIMVTWEVQDTAKAVFDVNDYESYLSSQCDSALRNTVRLYPYDAPEDSNKKSLKDDSTEICEKLKEKIQESVAVAGIKILDARITHLAYSKEIAAAMLQRQQANAIIDAKRAIVDGAVGMVEMAIEKLSQNKNIALDDKTKASMVNNLLVVLCGNRESQPVVRNDIVE